MKAIQIDIFSGAAIAATADSEDSFNECLDMYSIIDPCKFCEYRGLCPSDECGALGFPIDVPSEDFISESKFYEMYGRMS